MNLNDYSTQAIATLLGGQGLDDMDARLLDQVFGLVGESGEVAEKFKKIIRDKHGAISDDDKQEIIKELGDILWYINSISHILGFSLEDIAQKNLDKVTDRKVRGAQRGSGDNR